MRRPFLFPAHNFSPQAIRIYPSAPGCHGMTQPLPKSIAIVGRGFAGVDTARALRKRLPPATQTDQQRRGGGAVHSSNAPQAHATPR